MYLGDNVLRYLQVTLLKWLQGILLFTLTQVDHVPKEKINRSSCGVRCEIMCAHRVVRFLMCHGEFECFCGDRSATGFLTQASQAGHVRAPLVNDTLYITRILRCHKAVRTLLQLAAAGGPTTTVAKKGQPKGSQAGHKSKQHRSHSGVGSGMA